MGILLEWWYALLLGSCWIGCGYDRRNIRLFANRSGGDSVSEVTTLKQLMLDAARYRWWRENIEGFIEDFAFVEDERRPGFIRCITADECDVVIDEILSDE